MGRKAYTFNPENQETWEKFASFKSAEILAHQLELDKPMDDEKALVVLNQYKVVAAKLDRVCPNWVNLTGDVVTKVKADNPALSSLINTFVKVLIENEFVKIKQYRPVIMAILPEEWKGIAAKLRG